MNSDMTRPEIKCHDHGSYIDIDLRKSKRLSKHIWSTFVAPFNWMVSRTFACNWHEEKQSWDK